MAAGDFVSGATRNGGVTGADGFIETDPLACTAGNSLLAFTSQYVGAGGAVDSVTDTAGNTYTKVGTVSGGDGNHHVSAWLATGIAAHASNVVTANYGGAASFPVMFVVQYEGALTFDATGAGSISAVDENPFVADAVTTTGDNRRLIGFYLGWDHVFGAISASSGNSTRQINDGADAAIVDALAASAGNHTTQLAGTGGTTPIQYWGATWAFSFGGGGGGGNRRRRLLLAA